jgi:hypothetical protein
MYRKLTGRVNVAKPGPGTPSAARAGALGHDLTHAFLQPGQSQDQLRPLARRQGGTQLLVIALQLLDLASPHVGKPVQQSFELCIRRFGPANRVAKLASQLCGLAPQLAAARVRLDQPAFELRTAFAREPQRISYLIREALHYLPFQKHAIAGRLPRRLRSQRNGQQQDC